jgi:hypothetical protein
MDQQQREVNEAAEKFAEAVRESFRRVADRAVSAQQLNVELTQTFFDTVISNLRAQAESNRQMTEEVQGQQERQREATQALTQESLGAYMDFVNSMFAHYQGRVEQAGQEIQQAQKQVEQAHRSAAPNESNVKAIQLLEEWLTDESGYDEETWPELKAALERDRLSDRKLFVD